MSSNDYTLKPFSRPQSRLEDEYTEPYEAWKRDPSPKTTGALLTALSPAIDKGISAHVGESNPILRSRARIMTAKSLAGFDPKQAALGTYVVNQLQGLKRVAGKQNQILRTPERIAIEQSKLKHHETELTADLGREPTAQELADYSGISLAKMAKLRRYGMARNEGYFTEMGDDESGGGFVPGVQHNTMHRLEIIYGDLDATNKKILEWSLGYHGAKRLSNQEIARRLGISPAAVSQRKALIQRTMDQSDSWEVF